MKRKIFGRLHQNSIFLLRGLRQSAAESGEGTGVHSLFERTQAGLIPTKAGDSFLSRCAKAGDNVPSDTVEYSNAWQSEKESGICM